MDTLDWHGYFPLAQGNLWQYFYVADQDPFGVTEEWYETWTIDGDTLINGQSYFVIETHCIMTFIYEGLGRDQCDGEYSQSYHRYDEERRNILVYRPLWDPPDQLMFGYDFRLAYSDDPVHLIRLMPST